MLSDFLSFARTAYNTYVVKLQSAHQATHLHAPLSTFHALLRKGIVTRFCIQFVHQNCGQFCLIHASINNHVGFHPSLLIGLRHNWKEMKCTWTVHERLPGQLGKTWPQHLQRWLLVISIVNTNTHTHTHIHTHTHTHTHNIYIYVEAAPQFELQVIQHFPLVF